MGPRLLALDTSTDRLAIALADGEREWHRCEAGGARASSRLIPAALELLREAGLAAAALDAVAFGVGPGAFTGLRSACAVAQGFAFGLQRPLLPIDSLMIVAEDARSQRDPPPDDLWVAMDARIDEIYAAAYAWRSGHWQASEPPALWTQPALAQRWREQPPACVAGNAAPVFGERLPVAAGSCIVTERDRARALLALARRQWALGATVSPAQALPLYLRDKVALTTAEREAAARGKAAR